MAGVSAGSETSSAPDVPQCVPVLEPTISLGGDKSYQQPSVIANWCDDMKKFGRSHVPWESMLCEACSELVTVA